MQKKKYFFYNSSPKTQIFLKTREDTRSPAKINYSSSNALPDYFNVLDKITSSERVVYIQNEF